MMCEKCGSENVHIVDSRWVVPVEAVSPYRRRRHKCKDCGYTWSRYEISEAEFIRLRVAQSQDSGTKNRLAVIDQHRREEADRKAWLAKLREEALRGKNNLSK